MLRLFSFLLLATSSIVLAQEKPYFQTKLYDPNANYRQDVCGRHASYYAGKVELRDALQGLELRPLMAVGRLFPLKDGAIDPDDPGLYGVLMDELGKRAGFEWRNSYAINEGTGGRTYTELLVWGTDTFDIAVDWFMNSLERLKLGIGFPRGFYDSSYILVGTQSDTMNDRDSANLFSLLKPFKPSVWWTIIGTILASAVVYMVLENLNRQVKHKWALGRNIFYSMLLFTQHFQFHPLSHAARLFSVSLAFWSLIIVATYTANLASFFVVQNAQTSAITGIEDVVAMGAPICVTQAYASTDYVRENFPDGIYIEKESEEATFYGVEEGECSFALSTVTSWEQFQRDRNINADCNFIWVGRVIKYVDAGFGVKADAGVKCTGLIQDVLNVHLVEMQADGFIDRAWRDFMHKNSDIDCNAIAGAHTEALESQKLSLNEMSGTFFLHFLGIVLALIITVVRKFRVDYMTHHGEMMDDESDDLNSVANDTEEMVDENEEAIQVFEMQLNDYRHDQMILEKQFFANLREKQQKMAEIMTLLQTVKDGKNNNNNTTIVKPSSSDVVKGEETTTPQ